MIHAVLVFNSKGEPRVSQWFTQMSISQRQNYLQLIFDRIRQRSPRECNFVDARFFAPDARLVYRSFATLYFVFLVDSLESELAILDLIQVFVEALDRAFTNVCELDLVFKPDQVQSILQEIVSVSTCLPYLAKGGMVLETNVAEIMAMYDLKKLECEKVASSR